MRKKEGIRCHGSILRDLVQNRLYVLKMLRIRIVLSRIVEDTVPLVGVHEDESRAQAGDPGYNVPLFGEICQVQDEQENEKHHEPVGILEPDIMLVAVVRHKAEGNIRDHKKQSADIPRGQRNEEQRSQRVVNVLEVRLCKYIFHEESRIQQNILCHGKDTGLTGHEIEPVMALHNTQSVTLNKGDDHQEVNPCDGQCRASPLPLLHSDHKEQGEDDHVNRRVLLDHEGQDEKDQSPPVLLFEEEINEPEDKEGQELIFMEVVEQGHADRRADQIDERDEESRHGPELPVPADQEKRNDRRKDHDRLDDEQSLRRSVQHVDRQEQIINRRKMNIKMRKQIPPLAGRKRHAGRRHILIHLGEDPHVKAGRAKNAIAADCLISEKSGEDRCQNDNHYERLPIPLNSHEACPDPRLLAAHDKIGKKSQDRDDADGQINIPAGDDEKHTECNGGYEKQHVNGSRLRGQQAEKHDHVKNRHKEEDILLQRDLPHKRNAVSTARISEQIPGGDQEKIGKNSQEYFRGNDIFFAFPEAFHACQKENEKNLQRKDHCPRHDSRRSHGPANQVKYDAVKIPDRIYFLQHKDREQEGQRHKERCDHPPENIPAPFYRKSLKSEGAGSLIISTKLHRVIRDRLLQRQAELLPVRPGLQGSGKETDFPIIRCQFELPVFVSLVFHDETAGPFFHIHVRTVGKDPGSTRSVLDLLFFLLLHISGFKIRIGVVLHPGFCGSEKSQDKAGKQDQRCGNRRVLPQESDSSHK